MYTRRSLVLGLLAGGLLAAQDAPPASGKTLSGPPGRFRLVVSKDEPAARSIRILTKLEVVQLRK